MNLLPPPSDVADMLSLEPKHKRFLWRNTGLWWQAKIVSKNDYFIIHSILYTKNYNPPDQNIFHQGTMPWVSKKLRISVEFICFSGPKSNKPVNINVVSWGLDINKLLLQDKYANFRSYFRVFCHIRNTNYNKINLFSKFHINRWTILDISVPYRQLRNNIGLVTAPQNIKISIWVVEYSCFHPDL